MESLQGQRRKARGEVWRREDRGAAIRHQGAVQILPYSQVAPEVPVQRPAVLVSLPYVQPHMEERTHGGSTDRVEDGPRAAGKDNPGGRQRALPIFSCRARDRGQVREGEG